MLACASGINWDDTLLLSPPAVEPHVTTEPSDFNAANASSLENISTTPELNCDDTLLLSPPLYGWPHVTTEPSVFTAANASEVEYISTTPELI